MGAFSTPYQFLWWSSLPSSYFSPANVTICSKHDCENILFLSIYCMHIFISLAILPVIINFWLKSRGCIINVYISRCVKQKQLNIYTGKGTQTNINSKAALQRLHYAYTTQVYQSRTRGSKCSKIYPSSSGNKYCFHHPVFCRTYTYTCQLFFLNWSH